MRNSAQQIESLTGWKQEVNRRVAQHQGRRARLIYGQRFGTEVSAFPAPLLKADGRSLDAAARVAARYAKVPSYDEMIARDARAALQATLPAPQIVEVAPELVEAMPAQAAPAQEMPFATPISNAPDRAEHTHAAFVPESLPPHKPASAERSYEIRFDADLPAIETAVGEPRSFHGTGVYSGTSNQLPMSGSADPFEMEEIEMIEPAQPIHANLIQFPRELVAAQKARPRRAETVTAEPEEAQLSIYEAQPEAVAAPADVEAPVVAAAATTAPAWSGMQWATPVQEPATQEWEASIARDRSVLPATVDASRVAPLSRRLLAGIVDFSLVTAAFLAASALGVANAAVLPTLREMEVGGLAALLLTALFYHALFFGLSTATPGMQYASLELRTFGEKRPTLRQRLVRAVALVGTLGVGASWAIVDGQQLSCHDRLSGTYLRKV